MDFVSIIYVLYISIWAHIIAYIKSNISITKFIMILFIDSTMHIVWIDNDSEYNSGFEAYVMRTRGGDRIQLS